MACFKEAVRVILERKVDFVLIAGDLFNTALPQIDYIKEVTAEIKKFQDHNIPVYMVAGSHDYSPSGKTMLDVLEKAGLIINVMKFDENNKLLFSVEPKTGAKITGMYGKKGGLEINEYESLDVKPLEAEEGFKIFMFHTAINELKPSGLEEMPGADLASLPNNFQYYAGGHVHYIFQKEFGKGVLTFPGALFPNNFKELEEWQHGGVYFCDEQVNWEYHPVKLKDVQTFRLDVEVKTQEQGTDFLMQEVRKVDCQGKIVTLRVTGEIEGKPGDVDFSAVFAAINEPYIVLKNTAKLRAKASTTIAMKEGSVEEIETGIMQELQSSVDVPNLNMDEAFMKQLMTILAKEKGEGEKVADFEQRVLSEVSEAMLLENP